MRLRRVMWVTLSAAVILAIGVWVMGRGPAIPPGHFGWVMRTPRGGAPYVSDVFNIPRYEADKKRIHKGVDFADSLTQPIQAAYGGTVSGLYSDPNDPNLFYTYFKIAHTGALYSVYAHWQNPSVSNGSVVAKGVLVAELGNGLGHYGPHLHFATTDSGGNYCSPAPYFGSDLPFQKYQLEFINHTPVTTYTPGEAVTISFLSGRASSVLTAELRYRTAGRSDNLKTMTPSGSTWTATIPGAFTAGRPSFEYCIKVVRKREAPWNDVDGNYACRPVSEASTLPSTYYCAYSDTLPEFQTSTCP